MKRDLATLASELTLKDVQRLLREKEREAGRVQKLQTRREELLAQVQAIEAEIESLAGAAPKAVKKPRAKKGGRRGRRKGVKTVATCAVEFLSSAKGDSRLGEIVRHVVKVRKGGAEPTRSDWTTVSTALRKEESVKRVGKGLYSLVGKEAGGAGTAKKKATKKKAKKKMGKKASKGATR